MEGQLAVQTQIEIWKNSSRISDNQYFLYLRLCWKVPIGLLTLLQFMAHT